MAEVNFTFQNDVIPFYGKEFFVTLTDGAEYNSGVKSNNDSSNLSQILVSGVPTGEITVNFSPESEHSKYRMPEYVYTITVLDEGINEISVTPSLITVPFSISMEDSNGSPVEGFELILQGLQVENDEMFDLRAELTEGVQINPGSYFENTSTTPGLITTVVPNGHDYAIYAELADKNNYVYTPSARQIYVHGSPFSYNVVASFLGSIQINVVDSEGSLISGAVVESPEGIWENGYHEVDAPGLYENISVSAPGFITKTIAVEVIDGNTVTEFVVLVKEEPNPPSGGGGSCSASSVPMDYFPTFKDQFNIDSEAIGRKVL